MASGRLSILYGHDAGCKLGDYPDAKVAPRHSTAPKLRKKKRPDNKDAGNWKRVTIDLIMQIADAREAALHQH